MSESTFGNDLDALVRGEHITSDDELTRFASDLYTKEQNVTMPNALKLRIANDLGLATDVESTRHSAPVSRRTRRANAAPPAKGRTNRPWLIGLAAAAAILLAITGIVRMGIPTNNNEPDNQFLMAPTAVPTLSATPDADATPLGDLGWEQPITADECVTEPPAEGSSATVENFQALRDQEFIIAGQADPQDAAGAYEILRQFIACDDAELFRSEEGAAWMPYQSEAFSPPLVTAMDEWLEDGLTISAELEEHGLEPADTMAATPSTSPAGQYYGPEPELAFVLEDGRIGFVSTTTQTTESTAIGSVYMLVQEDGEWKVGRVLPLCLGECDGVLETYHGQAMGELWLIPISPEECATNEDIPAEFSDAERAAIKSRQYRACEMNGESGTLQSPDYRLTEGEDAQPLSEEIEALYGETGESPGSLQKIAPHDLWLERVELLPEPWNIYDANSVVTLEDGRIVTLETTVHNPETVSGSGRTSPVITTALVWEVDGDDWLLDEEVTVCLGDCDQFWETESTPAAASSQGTGLAVTIPDVCEVGGEFVADFATQDSLPVHLRPEPITEAGVYVEVLTPGTELQYLCESEETSNPAQDRMDEGDQWLKIRTEDGTEGWIREMDVRELAP